MPVPGRGRGRAMRQVKSRPDYRDSAGIDASLLQRSSVAFAVAATADGHIVWANERFRDLLGAPILTALESRKLSEFLVAPSDWDAWRDVPASGRAIQLTIRTAGGTVQTLRGDIRSNGEGPARTVSGLFVAVDEQPNLRGVAQRAARMEALGSLTAGIAHDFNNLLTVLVGNLYVVTEA